MNALKIELAVLDNFEAIIRITLHSSANQESVRTLAKEKSAVFVVAQNSE